MSALGGAVGYGTSESRLFVELGEGEGGAGSWRLWRRKGDLGRRQELGKFSGTDRMLPVGMHTEWLPAGGEGALAAPSRRAPRLTLYLSTVLTYSHFFAIQIEEY